MMCIPKIDEHLEILTNEEVKDFVDFKSIEEEQNLRKSC